ncbi:hypothetical protein PIROE2DRAFT_63291 [Piromyces sp. E2]|nr:hypothetical protein PIROE2DRAFT_63291 [Piromyces sp. E2]|eukprot:OUM60224.1 hypothetical protein PIROE2DRAFT_63291 [Piromyces sp. E2]
MVSEVRAEINFSKYLKISQSILDKCINALGVYTEEDLQIRKEILNSINEIWAIFNDRDVDAENKLEACKLLDKHVELLDPAHRERSINLSVELKTQTLISGLMINEDINEIIEQIFEFNEIFNEKNSIRIEEIYIQNDLITLRKKFPFELFEIDFISYIIYFINNYSEIFVDQKDTQLGKIEWNHPATEEIKYRLKYGHGKKDEKAIEIVDNTIKGTEEQDVDKGKSIELSEKDNDDQNKEVDEEAKQPKKRGRKRKRVDNKSEEDESSDKLKANKPRKAKAKDEDNVETSESVEDSTSKDVKSDGGDDEELLDEPKQRRHTKKRWNEAQEKFLEECIKNNNYMIEPKKFYDEHGPNGTISHTLGDFTVNNIRDKCKSEKRKRIKLNMNLGVYANAINNSYHIQMEIQNELVNHKRVPNCRRRRWTDEQLKCLEKCILESNGNIYPSLILNLHGPNGIQSNILGNQTRQSIHDKCKNEKWKRIQQGLPLGAFEKAAKKSLSSIGNKWKNTKVLKEYVASSEGKRRKRNVDPYYKPDHSKKGRKRKSANNEESDDVGSSNATSQSQDTSFNNSSYPNDGTIVSEGYNDSSNNNSFIHINEANSETFIPTNEDSANSSNINNSNMYIDVNNPNNSNDDVYNIKNNSNKIENADISKTKSSFESGNPFQFSEKESSEYYFPNTTSEKKMTETDFNDSKNDENSNHLNNPTDVKITSIKPVTEAEFFKGTKSVTTALYSKDGAE